MPRTHLIVSAQYLPHVGGVEIFTDNLARALVARGDNVLILTSSTKGAPAREHRDDGVVIWRAPSLQLFNGRLPLLIRTSEYRRMKHILGDLPIDRVLVNTRFYDLSLAGAQFAFAQQIPCIVLDHGSDWLTFGSPIADKMVRTYEWTATQRVLSQRPSFAGISKKSTEWLSTLGIKTNHVIPNAIDAKAFRAHSSGRDFRRELGIGHGQRLVVLTGRLTPEKGVLQLAEAMRLLGDDYACAIAGEGKLRREIEQLDLPNVHLLGNISRSDLSALLSDADVFCLPSRSEGFCTALLEAAAWGATPCITHVGGVDEVLGNPPKHGVILESADAATLSDGIRRAASLQAGRDEGLMQRVERNCSWKNTIERLDCAFDAIAG